MPEQIRFPYGDAFIVNTPNLDRMAERLYAEQKNRELRNQQEAQALDAGLQKEFAQIRSVDVPEVIGNYQKYKQAKKELLFNKDLHKDPIAYAKQQQAANELQAQVYGSINASKEQKKRIEQLVADKTAHPLVYGDDAAERLSAYQQTPLSQLQKHPKYGDLTNMDSYIYKGTNTDFSKILNSAVGQPKPVYSEKKPVDKQGLQEDVTEYSFANTPLQVRDNILGALGQHQAGRDASLLWKSIPDTEKDQIDQAYAAIPKDKVAKAGMKELPDLPTNTGNDAMDFANFQAKKYFLANEPKAGTPKRMTNEAVKGDLEFARQKEMQRIRNEDAKGLIALRKSIDPNDTEMNNTWVDAMVGNMTEDALKNQPAPYKYGSTGKTVAEYDIPMNAFIAKALARNGREPTYFRYNPNTQQYRPIFPQRYEKGDKLPNGKDAPEGQPKSVNGRFAVDAEDSQPMSLEQLKLNLGYKGVTKKQLGKEVMSGQKPKATKKDDPLGIF